MPVSLSAAFLALGLAPAVGQDASDVRTLFAVSALLAGWASGLRSHAATRRRRLAAHVALRPQHYVQACAHTAIFVYWGWYWRTVYDEAALRIVAQLLFAYAFDMLLTWSRRDTYALGMGPVPIVLSTNLFLWFRPGWFHLQLAMIAVAFAVKEFVRWERNGRRMHIFNPSSLALAMCSVGLILAGATGITWGQEIAITQFFPPHMYLFLFLVSLPGQYLFGVATMTVAAVAATYAFGLAYVAVTGVYFFYDSYIPIAVFLGMLLLVTDPSTSPRTELGRVMFGALYGLSAVALYQVLFALGLPTFYDKLLQVPLLNLSVRAIDRTASSVSRAVIDPSRWGRWLEGRRRNLASLAVWAAVFGGMSVVHGVGDDHPGQWLPFWQQACDDGRPGACEYLRNVQAIYCRAGSGWSCNEWGLLEGRSAHADLRRSPDSAVAAFERGCDLGTSSACDNLADVARQAPPMARGAPELADLPIVLRGSKGALTHLSPFELHARACAQGWPDACATDGRARQSGQR